jgi:hypothetical protein
MTVKWPLLAFGALALTLGFMRPAEPGLIWWTTHGLEKIRPSDRRPANAEEIVKISAARNEFEAFQVMLRTEGRDIESVDVEVTELREKGGAVIPANSASIYLERYIDLQVASSDEGATGEWPDALIPRVDRYFNEKRSALPVKLVHDRTQPVWIDVYVPISAKPGLYQGQIRISSGGTSRVSIPLELEVWNFQLPSTSSLPTTFGFSGNTAVRAHRGKYTNDDDIGALTSLYQKAALLHRITLDGSAGLSPSVTAAGNQVQVNWTHYDKFMAPFMDGLMLSQGQPLQGAKATSVALHTPRSLTTPEQQMQFWRNAAQHFRVRGWFDRLFHYLWDEPKAADYPKMIALGRTVRRADPAVKNLVTAPLNPGWSDFIDVWSPLINCFERKAQHSEFCDPMVERRAYDPETTKQKKLWWYQSCASHGCFVVGGDYFRGWPSYMVDTAPVRNRIMEWLSWKYGMQGELYFATNEAYIKKPDPWKDISLFGGNGDGTLFYPGLPNIIGGTTHIPIESMRLKLIREGLEDYEYLTMLAKLKGPAVVADSVNGVIRSTFDFDQDPKKLYAVRESMGREIHKLSTQ